MNGCNLLWEGVNNPEPKNKKRKKDGQDVRNSGTKEAKMVMKLGTACRKHEGKEEARFKANIIGKEHGVGADMEQGEISEWR